MGFILAYYFGNSRRISCNEYVGYEDDEVWSAIRDFCHRNLMYLWKTLNNWGFRICASNCRHACTDRWMNVVVHVDWHTFGSEIAAINFLAGWDSDVWLKVGDKCLWMCFWILVDLARYFCISVNQPANHRYKFSLFQ